MNKGSGWTAPGLRRFTRIVKRRIPLGDKRTGYECEFCGRVFTRKHVRWLGDGWSCRDRCERERKGPP